MRTRVARFAVLLMLMCVGVATPNPLLGPLPDPLPNPLPNPLLGPLPNPLPDPLPNPSSAPSPRRADSTPALRLGGVVVPRRIPTLFALPVAEALLPRPCAPNATRHDNLCVRRLEGRVRALEKALSAVCSAVLHADDVAFAERSASGMGDVYFDSGLHTRRRPRYLRSSLLAVMQQHGIADQPPATHWQPERASDTL